MADLPPGIKDFLTAIQRRRSQAGPPLSDAEVRQIRARLARQQAASGPAVTRRAAMTGGAVVGGMSMAGMGGQNPPPMNAPPAGLVYPGVQPGVSGGVILARYVIVFGVGDGVFVYSGAPKLGNPPIAWMGSGLVDPYGNVLPTTTGVAGSGTFSAGDVITTSNGTVGYTSTPAANNMAYSDSESGFTDQFGNVVLSGRAVYNGSIALVMIPSSTNLLTFTNSLNQSGTWTAQGTFQLSVDSTGQTPSQLQPGSLALQNSGPPLATNIPAGFAALYCSTSGQLGSESKDSITGLFPVAQQDTTTLTNNNLGGANRVTAIYTIPANNLHVGTEWCIEIPFQAAFAGVAADTLELGLSIDGSSSYTANNTINGAIVGAGVSVNGVMRVYLKCTATGSGTGRINAWTDGSVNQTSATTTFANSGGLVGNPATGVTLDTTASHTIRVNSTWAVSNISQTLSVFGSKCTRTGP